MILRNHNYLTAACFTRATLTTTILTAEDGHKLTQASDETPLEEHVITDKVYLAVTDSPENWKEVSEAEAAELTAAIEARRSEIEEVQTARMKGNPATDITDLLE